MEPIFTNDAVVFGLLMIVLAAIFVTAQSKSPGWQKFYTYVPPLLLCYFVPALLHWPLGLIASSWYDLDAVKEFLLSKDIVVPAGASYKDVQLILEANGISMDAIADFRKGSNLYNVSSRYLLPASLVLLCIGIDFKGIINLGPKALIMFLAATLGIVLGGPIALLVITNFAPNIIPVSPDELWRGLSTIAGSWIGGGANQTAMKEIYQVSSSLFATMVIVDVVVANIWMGFLLYGTNITKRIDKILKADTSAIDELERRMTEYRASVERIPTTTSMFVLGAIAFGATGFSHFLADIIVPYMSQFKETLIRLRLESLISSFFWIVVIATTVGLLLSFTKARSYEGVGASRWGSVFIYILVATIGMQMNLSEVFNNLGLFAIGIIWMFIHVLTILLVAKLIRAPFFFVAVGSQANVGGAASAPVVAAAFSPSLASVGVLLAVLGYALGTYGAIICALLMQAVAT